MIFTLRACLGGRFGVDDGDAGRDVKAEKGIGDGGIETPGGEFELDFDATFFADEDAGEFAGGGSNFKIDRLLRTIRLITFRRIGWGRVRAGVFAAERAIEDDVFGGGGFFVRGEFDASTDTGQFHFAGEKGEGSAPIGALFGRRAGNGVVGGDVKPGVLSIYEKSIFFGRLVLPAHFAGAAKIGDASFGADYMAVFGVALEKSGGESVVAVVAGFQLSDEGFGFGRGGR